MKRTGVKIGNTRIEPDWRLYESLCKYSEDGIFRKRCSDYQTEECGHCKNNTFLHYYDKPEKVKRTSYFDHIGGI